MRHPAELLEQQWNIILKFLLCSPSSCINTYVLRVVWRLNYITPIWQENTIIFIWGTNYYYANKVVFVQHSFTSSFFKMKRHDCHYSNDPAFSHGPRGQMLVQLWSNSSSEVGLPCIYWCAKEQYILCNTQYQVTSENNNAWSTAQKSWKYISGLVQIPFSHLS